MGKRGSTLEGVSVALERRAGTLRGARWLPPLPEPPPDARGRALLAAQSLLLLAMTATVATRTWQDHTWFGVGLAGLTLAVWAFELPRRRLRSWWFVYVAGIFVYTLLRAVADETAIPIRFDYAIDFDRALFGGTDPTAWLQRSFFDPRAPRLLDYLAVAVHWSFFIAPHALAVGVFLYYRPQFPRYATLVVLTMWFGLVLFFLVPTAPPWYAGSLGLLPGVRRVMDYVGRSIDPNTYSSLYEALGEPNAVAAMPSIHMAVTFAMYLWARRPFPRFGALLLVYSLAMAAALVYLGEHYVADVLAGAGCALLAWLATQRLVPLPAGERAGTVRPPSGRGSSLPS